VCAVHDVTGGGDWRPAGEKAEGRGQKWFRRGAGGVPERRKGRRHPEASQGVGLRLSERTEASSRTRGGWRGGSRMRTRRRRDPGGGRDVRGGVRAPLSFHHPDSSAARVDHPPTVGESDCLARNRRKSAGDFSSASRRRNDREGRFPAAARARRSLTRSGDRSPVTRHPVLVTASSHLSTQLMYPAALPSIVTFSEVSGG
jgi:hypothetical protein